jgi:glycerol-3-phosphate acyltransferase PlsY
MVSAGSIAAAAVLSVAVFFFPAAMPVRVVTVVVAVLVILKHRANLRRILKGQENRI